MRVNHLYQLRWAKMISYSNKNAKILDYGCGLGEVIRKGRDEGFNIYGADSFNAGNRNIEAKLMKLGLLNKVITKIKNQTLDYEDNFFDLIMSNQVLEHIEDLKSALKEIHRVLKKKGLFLSIFPFKGTLIEWHIGLPFVHWFKKCSRLRFYFALFLRNIGMGFHKKNLIKQQWVINNLQWLDNYTFYRFKKEILNIFSEFFNIRFIEHDYAFFRLNLNHVFKIFRKFLKISIFANMARFLIQKFSSTVILASKK